MARAVGATIARSGPSKKACYLRFINCTTRKVNVIWLDYSGYAVTYGTLEPQMHFDMHSYEGHPWISEDTLTKTRMLLNKMLVFYPTPQEEENGHHPVNNNNNRELRCYLPLLSNNEPLRNGNGAEGAAEGGTDREYVYITIPVLSLFERCAEVTAMNLHSVSDIESLVIPNTLKNVLRSYF